MNTTPEPSPEQIAQARGVVKESLTTPEESSVVVALPAKGKISPLFRERCYDPPMKDLIADPILIGIGNQTLAAFAEEHSIGDILRYAISRSDIDEVRCLLEMESKAAAPPAPPPAEGELAELVRELETVAEQFDQGTPEERRNNG